MSDLFEGPVQDLIDELGKLPGIGPKSAQRIAFHLLSVAPPDIDRLTAALGRVRDGVTFCEVCGNVSDLRSGAGSAATRAGTRHSGVRGRGTQGRCGPWNALVSSGAATTSWAAR